LTSEDPRYLTNDLTAQAPHDEQPSILRKRQLTADGAESASVAGELDIAGCAIIAFTSEDPAHPVEHLLDRSSGPGATRWASARADTIEQPLLEYQRLLNRREMITSPPPPRGLKMGPHPARLGRQLWESQADIGP
jgi:hypothetical protein